MICPKCKNQVPEKTLKCNHCGAKIATFCKNCNAYNSIYNLRCSGCNIELLKVCPACKTVNLPNVEQCRKCAQPFVVEIEEANSKQQTANSELSLRGVSEADDEAIQEENKDSVGVETPTYESSAKEENLSDLQPLNSSASGASQLQAKELLKKAIISQEAKILSLSGAKGSGKSVVLKTVIHELKDSEIVWLMGECSAITQISPCGLIQDILLTFFNVMNFCTDNLKLKKDSQKFFQNEFPSLSNEEIFNLLNLLYPTNTDYFENLLINKDKTFAFLHKVFKTIIENHRTVIVIENFDFVDGFSYEFLHNLVNSELMGKKMKILLTYDEIRPVRGYLYSDKLYNEAYFDVSLGVFDKTQMNAFIDQYFGQYFGEEKCPASLKDQLFMHSSGNPAVLEQLVSLVSDYKMANKSFGIVLPAGFNDVMKMRLDFLSKNPQAYKILIAAAIQGVKFYPSIINQTLKMQENVFQEAIYLLAQLNFIVQINDFAFAFKNSMLWSGVFDIVKFDERYTELSSDLFTVYSQYTLSTNTIMAVIAQI